MTPSGKSARRKERRKRERVERQVRRAIRSNLIVAGVAFVAMLGFLGCALGLDAFWCVPQPILFVVTLAASAIAGLALGGTIRALRERRALARSERG
jgi:hypothetical protein